MLFRIIHAIVLVNHHDLWFSRHLVRIGEGNLRSDLRNGRGKDLRGDWRPCISGGIGLG